ncbi:S-adenosyl-L-methionine-dependent methyltransferase [Lipomyces oligophaga]|uniref:S-adenosyl-L-methionine-dependent methyltransferase n=1 Tax=Lipomyces oligophaga TaxID=45792 RepID=UPI0034CD4CA3
MNWRYMKREVAWTSIFRSSSVLEQRILNIPASSVRWSSSRGTQLPKPDRNGANSLARNQGTTIQRVQYIPPSSSSTKTKDGFELSPEELRSRRIKYFGTCAVTYVLFLAGAYYYFTGGNGAQGPYREAEGRDTRLNYEELAERYDNLVNRDELFMGLAFWRKEIANELKGDVLEVSCGTGRNVKHIDVSKLSSITFVDTSQNMVERTRARFDEVYPKYEHVHFLAKRAEDLPLNKQYDTIFETFGLCSYEDPVAALVHLQKLLKPGGRLLLLEHGRGTWDFINRILDKSAASRADHLGCRWNLDIGEIARESGLEIDKESRSHFGTTWTIFGHRQGDELPPPPKKKFLFF